MTVHISYLISQNGTHRHKSSTLSEARKNLQHLDGRGRSKIIFSVRSHLKLTSSLLTCGRHLPLSWGRVEPHHVLRLRLRKVDIRQHLLSPAHARHGREKQQSCVQRPASIECITLAAPRKARGKSMNTHESANSLGAERKQERCSCAELRFQRGVLANPAIYLCTLFLKEFSFSFVENGQRITYRSTPREACRWGMQVSVRVNIQNFDAS